MKAADGNHGFNVRRHEPVIVIKVGFSDVGSSSRGNTSDTSLKLFGVKQSEVV